LKVAIVQEWLTTIGGSEKVVVEICNIFPDADLFTLVAIDETVEKLGLQNHRLTTSFIQKMPFAQTKWRSYLALFPLAIEQFDLSEYDLVISSSHSVAKGVLTTSNQVHVCYCHSPIRYAWDLHHRYLKESGLNKGLKGFVAKYILHRIRVWDIISVNRVDYFIANSNYIAKRIKKTYNRDSVTIYPNVAVTDFDLSTIRENYYFTCSRFVPYKKIDLIVRAFVEMPEKKLYVIGDGPDFKKIKKMATNNVVLLGYQPFEVLKKYLSKAKAFVFAAEEDFGIIPVEAQASGTPVIAYGKGGSKETVINDKTGVFFYDQTPAAIIKAIAYFEENAEKFNYEEIQAHAAFFSTQNFRTQFSNYITEIVAQKKE
jgi:glycosyltransferase involved in cell wall biosynthesis